ncbi:hypothetical protein M3Y99_01431100 [Aphelenchoides fujianensis]|nr:hypothetical protein M3Y99_01431100 [Aphelenchoides fujianensis]
MSVEDSDSFASSVTQTWPKSRITKNLVNDAKSRIKTAGALERAKALIEQEVDENMDEKTREARELVQHLYEALEQKNKRRGSGFPLNSNSLDPIHEEQPFGSMIICEPARQLSRQGSIASIANPYFRSFPIASRRSSQIGPEQAIQEQVVEPEDVYGDLDPARLQFYIRAVPHVVLFLSSAIYIFLGAVFFQQIDADLHQKPYKDIVLFTYQICATIGWGDTSVKRPWSQVVVVFYAVIGVPLIMASFANCGRLLTEFYCIDWIFLTSVVRGKKPTVQDFANQLPIKGAINLLIGHQLIGLLLFNGLIEDIGVVGSVYFSITSMATIGFGDIVVKPSNAFELVVLLSYASSGIIVLSALFISISYYIQLALFLAGFPDLWRLKEKDGEQWLEFVPLPERVVQPKKSPPAEQAAQQEPTEEQPLATPEVVLAAPPLVAEQAAAVETPAAAEKPAEVAAAPKPAEEPQATPPSVQAEKPADEFAPFRVHLDRDSDSSYDEEEFEFTFEEKAQLAAKKAAGAQKNAYGRSGSNDQEAVRDLKAKVGTLEAERARLAEKVAALEAELHVYREREALQRTQLDRTQESVSDLQLSFEQVLPGLELAMGTVANEVHRIRNVIGAFHEAKQEDKAAVQVHKNE